MEKFRRQYTVRQSIEVELGRIDDVSNEDDESSLALQEGDQPRQSPGDSSKSVGRQIGSIQVSPTESSASRMLSRARNSAESAEVSAIYRNSKRISTTHRRTSRLFGKKNASITERVFASIGRGA